MIGTIKKKQVTLGDDGISLRSSERRPHTIIRYVQACALNGTQDH